MKVGIVLGSSRSIRLGERVCKFILREADKVPGADFQILDLREYGLPFYDEAIPPQANPARNPPRTVQRWLSDMASADAYVFVTPEYNFGIPGVLKNALDFLAYEAEGKPALIVSYSDNVRGGDLAGQELRLIISKLGMFPLPKSIPLGHAERLFDESGVLVERSDWGARVSMAVPRLISDLVRYAAALGQIKAENPTFRPLPRASAPTPL